MSLGSVAASRIGTHFHLELVEVGLFIEDKGIFLEEAIFEAK